MGPQDHLLYVLQQFIDRENVGMGNSKALNLGVNDSRVGSTCQLFRALANMVSCPGLPVPKAGQLSFLGRAGQLEDVEYREFVALTPMLRVQCRAIGKPPSYNSRCGKAKSETWES